MSTVYGMGDPVLEAYLLFILKMLLLLMKQRVYFHGLWFGQGTLHDTDDQIYVIG
jgi:hypothetical protein